MRLEVIKGQRGYAFDMIRNAETLELVAYSANPDLTALFAAAPEMLESMRDAVLFMQFLGKNERPLTDSEQRWLDNAVTLLRKIENDDPQSALAERIKLALDGIESEGE